MKIFNILSWAFIAAVFISIVITMFDALQKESGFQNMCIPEFYVQQKIKLL